jgi:hypothetical protein
MFKKRFIGLAPLLAIATFAVMPVVAQAEIQHWYRNGVVLPEITPVPFVMFGGKINVNQTTSVLGEINCRTVAGGTIENLEGGVGSMDTAAFYECKAPQCEEATLKELGVQGRGVIETYNEPPGNPERTLVGWSMRLVETEIAGVLSVRLKIGEPFVKFETPSPAGMIRLREGCEIVPSHTFGAIYVFEGELDPEIGLAKKGNLNGTTPGKPSTTSFSGASTGVLHNSFPSEATYQGSLKYLGYNEQELITVKP